MKIKNIIIGSALMATFGGMMLTSCEESELYSADAPEWIADSVSAVAARNAANAGEEDAVSYGTLHETFTSNGWDFPKLHVEAQVGTWIFSSSDGKYTDVEIIGTDWWKAQSIDKNADGSNWTSSDFDLSSDGQLVLTFVPQTENAIVMWEFYGNGYWTTISEGNWWYAEDALPEKGGTGTGATSGYSYEDNGAYHFEVGSTVTLVITKSGSNYTAEVYYQKAPEFTPKSISVAGTPKAISYTEEEVDYNYYFGDATATVTWDNGAVSTVNAKDLTFTVVPDLKTVGTAIVTVAYGKTSKGNYCEPVSTGYNVEIVGDLTGIKIVPTSENPTYYYTPGTTEIKKDDIDITKFIKSVVGVSETAELPLSADSYTTDVTIPSTISAGQKITIKVTYKDLTTTLDVTLEVMADGWNGKIVGGGKFVTDETFGTVFENDGSAQRTSYFLMPEGTIPNCSESKAMTISFWVNGNGKAAMYAPLFSAYGAAPIDNSNTWPMFIIQGRGLLQTNCAGWINFDGESGDNPTNDKGPNVEKIDYLNDNEWHLVTVTITDTHAEFIVDKTVVNAWTYDGTEGKNATGFLTEGYSQLTYICLGGNQAWGWSDNDSGYKYAKFKIYDRVISSDEIAERIAKKE